MSKKLTEKEELWDTIQDIIGPANQWPEWIRNLFWTRNLNHAQRPLISAFIIFNGLNPEVSLTKYKRQIFFKQQGIKFIKINTLYTDLLRLDTSCWLGKGCCCNE